MVDLDCSYRSCRAGFNKLFAHVFTKAFFCAAPFWSVTFLPHVERDCLLCDSNKVTAKIESSHTDILQTRIAQTSRVFLHVLTIDDYSVSPKFKSYEPFSQEVSPNTFNSIQGK